jgi:rod shape-determining protein MreD
VRSSLDARGRWWVVPATFAIAMVVNSLILPSGWNGYRPDWVTLVLIYWCLALPQRFGVGSGWLAGLVLDLVEHSLLGQNALAKAVVGFLANRFAFRVRMFPLWQQSVVVLFLLVIDAALVGWFQSLAGHGVADRSWWGTVVSGTILWPLLYLVLRDTRRRSGLQ